MLPLNNYMKKVDKIKFGVMSPDDIRKISAVRVETPDTYDSDGYPIENGLMDSRMGVLDSSLRCHTCGVRGGDCQGHFGSIELGKPVVHVGFANIIHKILRSTCNECGRILLPDDVLDDYREKLTKAINNNRNVDKILDKINHETRKVEMHESRQEDIVDKIMDELYPEWDENYNHIERRKLLINILNQLYAEAFIIRDELKNIPQFKYIDPKQLCPHCRKNQSLNDIKDSYDTLEIKYNADIDAIEDDIWKSIERDKANNQKMKFDIEFKKRIYDYIKESHIQKYVQEPIIFDKPTTFSQGNYKLTTSEIKERLQRISDDDAFILGLNPDIIRPEWFVLTVLPVPPVTVRPSITLDTGERSEDDLTHKLVDVLRINQRLIENMEAGAPQLIVEDLWDLLQYHVTTYFDNEAPGVPPSKHRSGRPYKTLLQRLKGKDGRFRSNLSGKYVNFSARSVVAPDPSLSINEVGIPEIIAKEITVPIYVNEWNMDEIKQYIKNGPDLHPGANFMITESGNRRKINDNTKQFILENLKYGDIVEIHLKNGDMVLLNRQPSLHKLSLLAHQVKIHHNNTININPLVIPPYDAHFGGDEVNIHVLQTDEARAEAKSLMLVENNMISPRYGGPIIGALKDYLSGTFLLTKNGTEFSEEESLQILRKSNIKIPPFKNGKWILKYDDDYSEESFIYKQKGEKWTGKELFSLLIPNDLNLQFDSKINKNSKKFNDESYVRIEEGILKTGIIDENAIGAFSGHLLNKIIKEYGFKKARIFLEKTSAMSTAIFMKIGITNSLNDYEIPIEAQNKIDKHLEECEYRLNQLYIAYEDGILDCLPNKSLDETLEIRCMQVLRLARDYAGEICESYFDVNNQNFPFSTIGRNSAIMARTGASSSSLNLTQITACIGQQSIRGGRIHRGYIERVLPHFKRMDLSSKAHGFIKSSFRRGLDPIEFYFHAMGGREGLVNASVRTAHSGYMQRRLVNAMQDLKSNKNGLVIDNHDNVIQILYGDDGVDPVKSDFGYPVDLDRLIDEIKIKDDMDNVKISNFKQDHKKLQEVKKKYEMLSNKVNREIKHLPDSDDEEISEKIEIFNDFFNNKTSIPIKNNNNSSVKSDSILINDFRQILDNYKCELDKPFKNNDFALKIRKEFSNHFSYFIKGINKNYSADIICGIGNWKKYPFAIIVDRDTFKSNKEVISLNYIFNHDESKILLVITSNSSDNTHKINHLLNNIVKKNGFDINNTFEKSIILKEYSYNELDESLLKNDLETIFKIYNEIIICYNNTINSPVSRVINDFEEILTRYESEKFTELKNSSFALKLRDDYTEDVYNFVKSMITNKYDHFSVRSSFGISSWADKPVITIINDNVFDSFQEGLHINYTFNTKYSKIYLSINPKSKNKDEYHDLKVIFNEKLSEYKISNTFIIGENDIDEYSVILKEYSQNDLSPNLIENDFKELMDIYSKLCEEYHNFIKTEYEITQDTYDEIDEEDSDDFIKNLFNDSDYISIIDIKSDTHKFFNLNVYENNFDEINTLFNEENIQKLQKFEFTYKDYNNILKNIKKSYSQSLKEIIEKYGLEEKFNSLSPLDKVLLFAKSFTNVKYKKIGDDYGYLYFNTIYVEERLDEPLIITTIIHELTHFILAEILKQVIMNVLKTNKNHLIESFIFMILQEDLWYLLDEFCAHSVEGRFTLYGYQDYGSYEYKLNEVSSNLSHNDIDYSLNIASNFAQDINKIIESYIREGLRQDIKKEFNRINREPNMRGLNLEREVILSEDGVVKSLKDILNNGIEICRYKQKDLERYANAFKKGHIGD